MCGKSSRCLKLAERSCWKARWAWVVSLPFSSVWRDKRPKNSEWMGIDRCRLWYSGKRVWTDADCDIRVLGIDRCRLFYIVIKYRRFRWTSLPFVSLCASCLVCLRRILSFATITRKDFWSYLPLIASQVTKHSRLWFCYLKVIKSYVEDRSSWSGEVRSSWSVEDRSSWSERIGTNQ